jgi:hypothetical protein
MLSPGLHRKVETITFQRKQSDPESNACSVIYYIFKTWNTDMYYCTTRITVAVEH